MRIKKLLALASIMFANNVYANASCQEITYGAVDDAAASRFCATLSGADDTDCKAGTQGNVRIVTHDDECIIEVRHEEKDQPIKYVTAEWSIPQNVSEKIPENGEAWISYQLFFPEKSDAGKGGKLPGVAGGSTPSGGKDDLDGMTARLMWRSDENDQDAVLAGYVYPSRKAGQTWGDYYYSEYIIPRDQWITVTVGASAGTPLQEDGWLKVYVDGKVIIAQMDIPFKQGDKHDWSANVAMFNNFYGGGSDWGPERGSVIKFKNVISGTTRESVGL